MWKASSFRSSPSWTNESVTRCSSSGPSKNPHTWRWPPRIAPARWIGCEALALMRPPFGFPAKMLEGAGAVFQKVDRAFQEPIVGPASATMLPPVGGGGDAVQPLKRGRQVGLAAETGRKRDLRDRLLHSAQQGRGPLEPSPQQILVDRLADGPPEPPRETCGAHPGLGGQGQEREILAQVRLDVLDDWPETARGKLFGPLRRGGEGRMMAHQLCHGEHHQALRIRAPHGAGLLDLAPERGHGMQNGRISQVHGAHEPETRRLDLARVDDQIRLEREPHFAPLAEAIGAAAS